jgi:hypothetical protein
VADRVGCRGGTVDIMMETEGAMSALNSKLGSRVASPDHKNVGNKNRVSTLPHPPPPPLSSSSTPSIIMHPAGSILSLFTAKYGCVDPQADPVTDPRLMRRIIAEVSDVHLVLTSLPPLPPPLERPSYMV